MTVTDLTGQTDIDRVANSLYVVATAIREMNIVLFGIGLLIAALYWRKR